MATENDDDEDGAATNGSKRERSPNYPAITFTAALERAEQLYKKEKRNPMSSEIAARHLGYSKMNGASFQVLGALKRYGLLVSAGKDVRVSDDAHYIFIHPETHPDRLARIRSLAMSPPLFAKVKAAFPDGLPSEENLIAKLQTDDWGFKNREAAKAVVRALQDAMRIQGELANPVGDEDNNGNSIKETAVNPPAGTPIKTALDRQPPPNPLPRKENSGPSREWEISEGRFASVSLPPDPTVADVEIVEEFLSLLKQELALIWKRKARQEATAKKEGES